MKRINKLFILYFLGFPIVLMSQMQAYTWKAPLAEPSDIWHSVPLSDSIYKSIDPNFNALRIYGIRDRDTIQAPYILRSTAAQQQSETIPFTLMNKSKSQGIYYYTLALEAQFTITKIALDFGRENFDWRVGLQGSMDQRQWFSVLEDYRLVSFQNASERYSYTDLEFPKANYRYYRVSIRDDQDPKLITGNITATSEKPATYKNLSIKRTKVTEAGTITEIHVTLQQRFPISWVALNIDSDYSYSRDIAIAYVQDSIKTEKGWIPNYRTAYSGSLNDKNREGYRFSTVMANTLRIRIENKDNAPLALGKVMVKGYDYQLNARFTEDAQYYLVYDHPYPTAPQYDLKPSDIPTERPKVLAVGKPESIRIMENPPTPMFKNKAWLWGVMATIILVLGAATIYMLKEEGKRKMD